MKALISTGYGGWEKLKLTEIDTPTPKPNQVLVSIEYAGIESALLHLLRGNPTMLRLGLGITKPRNPRVGQTFSGKVSKVGQKVTDFKVGDYVYGVCDGSMAEFALAKSSKIAPMPNGISFEQAAGFPVSAVAAHTATVAESSTPNKVLVVGASGGVGSYLCQLLLLRGDDITATASVNKLSRMKELGITDAIEHQQVSSLPENSFQRIYVLGGNRKPSEYFKLLTSDGRVIILGSDQAGSNFFGGFFTNFWQSLIHPKRIKIVISSEKPESLSAVTKLLAGGKNNLRVVNGIDNAIEAVQSFEKGEVFGRLVLNIN